MTPIRGRYARSNSRWLITPTLAAAVLIVLALTGCGVDVALAPTVTTLQSVEDECDGDEGDPGWPYVYTDVSGTTLVVDHKGDEDSYGASFDQLQCVIETLDLPMSVTARMENTRALDGVQTTEWGGYEITWSFHPNTGMDLIIEETK